MLAEEHGYAFLATITADGAPRLHPVALLRTPAEVHLAVVETSLKLRDLRRDPRFALHSSVVPPLDEELSVRGSVQEITDVRVRERIGATRLDGAELADRMVLFALVPKRVVWTVWADGRPRRTTWRA
ncbi:pyridoxamine 5'-phosphate oxidase family protein [Pseudonocardia sp. CA-107938]|uniref:pyridoxamine 5'-phosphate oxidase family protein n=1 Tax=Pseudonocardia sp. CA-107938 TaxID=3240021 RepID=UPI003D90A570